MHAFVHPFLVVRRKFLRRVYIFIYFIFQFVFGAKLDEVPRLREKGPDMNVNLQFARVVRWLLFSFFTLPDHYHLIIIMPTVIGDS